MMLQIRRATRGRRVVVDVNADLFGAETAERMLRQFCHLAEQLVDHVGDPIDRLSIACAQDRRLLVESWNRTSMPFPSDSSLIDLFTAQVRLRPSVDVVLWDDRRV